MEIIFDGLAGSTGASALHRSGNITVVKAELVFIVRVSLLLRRFGRGGIVIDNTDDLVYTNSYLK